MICISSSVKKCRGSCSNAMLFPSTCLVNSLVFCYSLTLLNLWIKALIHSVINVPLYWASSGELSQATLCILNRKLSSEPPSEQLCPHARSTFLSSLNISSALSTQPVCVLEVAQPKYKCTQKKAANCRPEGFSGVVREHQRKWHNNNTKVLRQPFVSTDFCVEICQVFTFECLQMQQSSVIISYRL